MSRYVSRKWRCDCCGEGIPDNELTEVYDRHPREGFAATNVTYVVHNRCTEAMITSLERELLDSKS